jgi:hypothetical protein
VSVISARWSPLVHQLYYCYSLRERRSCNKFRTIAKHLCVYIFETVVVVVESEEGSRRYVYVCVVDESLRKCAHAIALHENQLERKGGKICVCEIYKVLLLKHVPRHRTLFAFARCISLATWRRRTHSSPNAASAIIVQSFSLAKQRRWMKRCSL